MIACLFSVTFPACSAFYGPADEAARGKAPFSEEEVGAIVSLMDEQESRVASFYGTGSVLVENRAWATESDILTIGTKSPLKIKIEITHSWGQPILHVLIDDARLKVLSFRENRMYQGPMSPESISRFFPGFLESDLIWAVLRGYPHLRSHDRIASRRANQISLLDDRGREIETIDFHPDGLFPALVTLPEEQVEVAFSRLKENGGISFAGEVRVSSTEGKGGMILKDREMVFNRKIPDAVFVLERPPGFETIDLTEDR